MTQFPLLSALIFIPILTAVALLLVGDEKNSQLLRLIAMGSMVLSTLLCMFLYFNFDFTTPAMQFTEKLHWLPQFGINYELGVDGISMPMILLSTFTTLVVLFATWNSIEKKVSQYLASFLLLQGLMVGVFASLDAILFYVFWEGTLIPMYLIIGMWGSANRVYASLKFFVYTFLGSAMMLVALLFLGFKAGNFNILAFYPLKLSLFAQVLIFIGFLLGFSIKIPMWPVHTWLPDAHTEAPAGGSIVLAAILLKLGAYGFLRFSLPIVPDACRLLAGMMITLSLIAVIYIALVALVQTDLKKLIAYSSISHMGFVTLGTFMIYRIVASTGSINDGGLGLEGAIVVMISHAFISGALFAGVGYLYERMHTRNIQDFGGIVNTMPMFASFFLLFVLANAGMPGTSGFVGEFMVILGSMKAGFWISFCAGTTLVFGAAYSLWMYKRVFFGDVANDHVAALQDISGYETVAFGMLASAVVILGIYPALMTNIMHQSVVHLLSLSQMTKV